MKKALVTLAALSLVAALFYFVFLEQWLWARITGVLFMFLFLFSAWKRKSRGLSTLLLSLSVAAFLVVMLWLYPAGIVGMAAVALSSILGCAIAIWEWVRTGGA